MIHSNSSANKIRKSLPMLIVLLLIGMAMVPYGWAAQFSSKAAFVVYDVLGGALTHIVGHFLLFALIGTAVAMLVPHLLKRPFIYFSLITMLGLLQEFLQLVTFKRRPVAFDDLFDVVVDLLGAAAAFIVLRMLSRAKEKSSPKFP